MVVDQKQKMASLHAKNAFYIGVPPVDPLDFVAGIAWMKDMMKEGSIEPMDNSYAISVKEGWFSGIMDTLASPIKCPTFNAQLQVLNAAKKDFRDVGHFREEDLAKIFFHLLQLYISPHLIHARKALHSLLVVIQQTAGSEGIPDACDSFLSKFAWILSHESFRKRSEIPYVSSEVLISIRGFLEFRGLRTSLLRNERCISRFQSLCEFCSRALAVHVSLLEPYKNKMLIKEDETNETPEDMNGSLTDDNNIQTEVNGMMAAELSEAVWFIQEIMTSINNFMVDLTQHIANGKDPSSFQGTTLFVDLIQSYSVILSAPLVPKDALTKASICLASTTSAGLSVQLKSHTNMAAYVAETWYSIYLDRCDVENNEIKRLLRETIALRKGLPSLTIGRGALATFDRSILLYVFDDMLGRNQKQSLFTGPLFDSFIGYCEDSDQRLQLYAMQSLESWLTKSLEFFDDIRLNEILIDHMHCLLTRTISLVSRCWENYSRSVTTLVPNIFKLVITLNGRLENHESCLDSGTNASRPSLIKDFLDTLLNSPANWKGRYTGLIVALPQVGAKKILEIRPDIMDEVFFAMTLSASSVTSPAALFFQRFVNLYRDELLTTLPGHAEQLKKENTKMKQMQKKSEILTAHRSLEELKLRDISRDIWLKHLASSLVSSSARARMAISHSIVFDLLSNDFDSPIPLMRSIREVTSLNIQNSVFSIEKHGSDIGLNCQERELWALLEVGGHARHAGCLNVSELLVGYHHSQESPFLSVTELERACTHGHDEIRISALTFLAQSSKQIDMPPPVEFNLLKTVIAHSIKTSCGLNFRNRLIRCISIVLKRIKVTTNCLCREIANLKKKTNTDSDAVIEEHKSAVQRGRDFIMWFFDLLETYLFPGASFTREVISLEVFDKLVNDVGQDTLYFSQSEKTLSKLDETREYTVTNYLQQICSANLVKTLINLYTSSWDRSRNMAYAILCKLPCPLPGYSTIDEVSGLLRWAVAMTGSGRQRESDAGGLIIKMVFKLYVQKLGWKLNLGLLEIGCGEIYSRLCKQELFDLKDDVTPELHYFRELVILLTHRLNIFRQMIYNLGDKTNRVQVADDSTMFAHGVISSLRYIIPDLPLEHKNCDPEFLNPWRIIFDSLLVKLHESMELCVLVLGENRPIEKQVKYEVAQGYETLQGSAVSTSDISFEVDCRGHLIIDENDVIGDSQQRIVMGAWLITRDLSHLVSVISTAVELPRLELDENISLDNISDCLKTIQGEVCSHTAVSSLQMFKLGEMLLSALSRLKHMGAVSSTRDGFQGFCEALFRQAGKNRVLSRVPFFWLQELVERLQSSKQELILRRSAGFGFSFLAILRAEPRNMPVTLLPFLMERLVSIAVQADEKAKIHSLNILRSIFLDGNLAADVYPYVSGAIKASVYGFENSNFAVRNSSLMVFSAVISRAVDNRKNQLVTAKRITATEFFRMYPDLLPFLLERLELSVNAVKRKGVESVADVNTLCPSLYPLLLLLSMLAPDFRSDELVTDGNYCVRDFIPLLQECSAQRLYKTRMMASNALCTFVCFEQIGETIRNIISGLPCGANDVTISHNHIHGALLQITQLLSNVKMHKESFLFQDENESEGNNNKDCKGELKLYLDNIEKEVEINFKNYLWIASSNMRCPYVRLACLELLEELTVAFPSKHTNNFENWLTQSCEDIVLHHTRDEDSSVAPIPGLSLFISRGVTLSISKGLSRERNKNTTVYAEESLSKLLNLLFYPHLDVRQAAVYSVASALDVNNMDCNTNRCAEFSDNILEAIFNCLLKTLTIESHPPCLASVLSTLSSILREKKRRYIKSNADAEVGLAPITLLASGIVSEYDKQVKETFPEFFLSLCVESDPIPVKIPHQITRCIKLGEVSAGALVILGDLIYEYIKASNFTDSGREVIQKWGKLILATSDKMTDSTGREAAIKSISSSDILFCLQNSEKYPAWLLKEAARACIALIVLLQDDEESTRELARIHACRVFLSSQGMIFELTTDCILPRIIDFLGSFSSVADQSIVVPVATLLLDILESKSRSIVTLLELHVSDIAGSRAREIFEKEEHNMYEESSFTVQLACQLLQSYCSSTENNDKICDVMRENYPGLITRFKKVAELLPQALQSSTWVGGISYNADVFPELYAILMFYGSIQNIANVVDGDLVNGLVSTCNVLHIRRLMHPVILAALNRIIATKPDLGAKVTLHPSFFLLK